MSSLPWPTNKRRAVVSRDWSQNSWYGPQLPLVQVCIHVIQECKKKMARTCLTSSLSLFRSLKQAVRVHMSPARKYCIKVSNCLISTLIFSCVCLRIYPIFSYLSPFYTVHLKNDHERLQSCSLFSLPNKVFLLKNIFMSRIAHIARDGPYTKFSKK